MAKIRYLSYDELIEKAKSDIPPERAPVIYGYDNSGTYRDLTRPKSNKNKRGSASGGRRESRFSGAVPPGTENPALNVLMRYERDGPGGFRFTEEGRRAAMTEFCKTYAKVGTIKAGCAAASVGRQTVAYWLENFPEFGQLLDYAREDYNDSLMEEIDRRARRGIVRTKYFQYQGEVVDSRDEIEYSDLLLIFHTKSRLPQYRDRAIDLGKDRAIDYSKVADLLNRTDDTYKSKPLSGPANTNTPSFGADPEAEVEVEVDVSASDQPFKYRWRDDPQDR